MENNVQTVTSLTLFLNFWPGLNTTSTTWIENELVDGSFFGCKILLIYMFAIV
jgi:hypothetical protein